MSVLEVSVQQRVTGSDRPVFNIFHLEATDPIVGGIADAVVTEWTQHILSNQMNTVFLDRVAVRELGGAYGYAERSPGVAGGLTGPAAPPNVAVLVRKTATGIPRKRFGRMFIVGQSEADIDSGGNLSSAWVTSWQNQVNDFLFAFTGVVQMVLPQWPSVWNGVPTSSVPVDGLAVQTKVATQRRRLRK